MIAAANRLPAASKPARHPVAKPVTGRRSKSQASQDSLHRWATAYVWIAVIMSSLLNAYANGLHATSTGTTIASWLLGAVVPALVLILFRVAGLLHIRRYYRLAKAAGAVGGVLLALSVSHCAHAIALLTGSDMVLAAALAVGIDCGLVVAEVVTIID